VSLPSEGLSFIEKTPFNSVAPQLRANGYKVIPIMPPTADHKGRGKAPGNYLGVLGWRPKTKWQQDASDAEVALWFTWPQAGIGVRTGEPSGIIALDFDYDIDGLHEKIRALVPDSPVQKKGAKGFTAFYRYNGEANKKWNIKGESVLELLSTRNQTVLPPSIHKDTGKPYYYITETRLEDVFPEDLPLLPDDFFIQMERLFDEGKPAPQKPVYTYPNNRADTQRERVLDHIDPEDYDDWLKVGMGLKHEFGEGGFHLWDRWSQRSTKYDAKVMRGKWSSFKGETLHPVTYGTIIELAKRNGFKRDYAPRQVIHLPITLKNTPANLEAIREKQAQEMRSIIAGPPRKEPFVHCFTYPTGTGKTTSTIATVRDLLINGELEKSILILVRSKVEARNFYTPLAATNSEQVFLMEGRSSKKGEDADPNPFYCPDKTRLDGLFTHRHHGRCDCGTTEYVPLCPYGEREAELFKLMKQGQKRRKPKKCVIVSTYGSFINDGLKMTYFDLIIVDEALEAANLVENVIVTQKDIENAQAQIDLAEEADHPVRVFLDALQQIQEKEDSEDFKPLWKQFYKGMPLDRLLCTEAKEEAGYICFPQESKSKRFMADLIKAIGNPNRVLTITPNGIEFCRHRNGLKILQSKEVISLDATPNKSLLENIFEKVQFYGELPLPQNIEITQFWGITYTKSNILQSFSEKKKGKPGSKRVDQVQALINHILDNWKPSKPLLVVPKAFREEKEGDEIIRPAVFQFKGRTIHFGGETRASNAYQDCDTMIIVGRHQEPPHITELRINALRRDTAPPPPSGASSTKKSRWMELAEKRPIGPVKDQLEHYDPLIQEAMDHYATSEIVQAIGRLRAINRPTEALKVAFICGFMLKDLVIHNEINVKPLLEKLDFPIGQKKPKALVERDQDRSNECKAKIEAALKQDPTLSRIAVARQTGLSPNTVNKHYNAVRESLSPPDHAQRIE